MAPAQACTRHAGLHAPAGDHGLKGRHEMASDPKLLIRIPLFHDPRHETILITYRYVVNHPHGHLVSICTQTTPTDSMTCRGSVEFA